MHNSDKEVEGWYKLENEEGEGTIVYGYHCSDANGQFGYGFNTYDGGGFIPSWDVRESSKAIPLIIQTKEEYLKSKAEICERLMGELEEAGCLDQGVKARAIYSGFLTKLEGETKLSAYPDQGGNDS